MPLCKVYAVRDTQGFLNKSFLLPYSDFIGFIRNVAPIDITSVEASDSDLRYIVSAGKYHK